MCGPIACKECEGGEIERYRFLMNFIFLTLFSLYQFTTVAKILGFVLELAYWPFRAAM